MRASLDDDEKVGARSNATSRTQHTFASVCPPRLSVFCVPLFVCAHLPFQRRKHASRVAARLIRAHYCCAPVHQTPQASLAESTALATEAYEAAIGRLTQCRIRQRSATSKAKPAVASTTQASRARRAAAAEATKPTAGAIAVAVEARPTGGAKPVEVDSQTKPSQKPVVKKTVVEKTAVEKTTVAECKMACPEGSKCLRGKCMKAFVGVRKDDPCEDEVEALTLAKRTLESLKQKAGDKRKESAADKKEGARDVLAFAAKALAKAEAALKGCTDDCELLTQAVAVAKSALVAATAAEATAEGDAVAAAKDALLVAAAEYVYSEGDEGDLPPLVAAGSDAAATDGNSTGTGGNTEEGLGETTTAAAMNKEDEAKLLLAAVSPMGTQDCCAGCAVVVVVVHVWGVSLAFHRLRCYTWVGKMCYRDRKSVV